MKGQSRLLTSLLILVCAAVVGLVAGYFLLAEREPPEVSIDPNQGAVSPETEMALSIRDQGSGMASLQVVAVQGDGPAKTILQEAFDAETSRISRSLSLKDRGFQDGPVELRITARDASWSNLFKGNIQTRTVTFTLDSQPPQITLESYRHNLNRGGSGLAGFTVSEDLAKAGIRIGEFFFPAYQQDNGVYLCFFSFPYTIDPGQDRPLVMVRDQAGNTSRAGFHHYVNDKRFPRSEIRLSDSFLQSKMVQFESLFPALDDSLDLFLKVNGELREKNRKALLEIGRETLKEPLWSGRFLRQPGAARRASFGVRRTYTYQGKEVDRQTHLGVDLASVARDTVPAANSGRVAFVGWLGIYGQIVVVDHGMGVQTMYAHLSQTQVNKNQRVSKGEIIGRTGATGLAGGDHLHFAVLISGVPVNPVEWWDQAWIENNILPKLELRSLDTGSDKD